MNCHRLFITSIIICSFCQFSSVLPAQTVSEAPTAKILNKFHDEVHELSDILRLPGFSLAVVKNGKIVYRQMEGYANLEKKIPLRDDHLFMIASITKTFTANLVMQYEHEHKASLEDYALNYRFINTYFGWPYNIDVNTKIRHFLSHTSEDGPGRSFVYNGSRFNYIYGLFEKADGYPPFTDAYSQELQKRIFDPLQMHQTIAGFPDSRSDTMFAHIATPYIFDTIQKHFREDTINYKWTQAFPATGILSTINDLVKYTTCYDQHTLITADNYQKVTTPATLSDGSFSPYGIGWFTEEYGGKKIHWHYGHADSYAALLVRVPETGYSFIFLSNSNAPSDALRLGAGHIWQSPFVTAFLKSFIFNGNTKMQKPLATENAIGKALFLHYAEQILATHYGKAAQLIGELAKSHHERFDQYDPALVYLLTDLHQPVFHPQVEQLAKAFQSYGHIQPYVLMDLARYYERRNDFTSALNYYQQLADAKGFEPWNESVDACQKTGQLYFKNGKKETARKYYWKAVNNKKMQFADETAIKPLIDEMNKFSNAILHLSK